MMYKISPVILTTPPAPSQSSTFSLDIEEHLASLEQEAYALRAFKKTFDGVKISRPCKVVHSGEADTVPKGAESDKAADATPASTLTSPAQPATSSQPSTSKSTTSDGRPPLHLFAKASEMSYLPPHERNFAGPPSKTKDKDLVYHVIAPIQNPKIFEDVYSQSMKAPVVTLSMEEYCAILPDGRTRLLKDIMPKCVATDDKTVSTNIFIDKVLPGGSFIGTMDTFNDAIVIPDKYDTCLKSL